MADEVQQDQGAAYENVGIDASFDPSAQNVIDKQPESNGEKLAADDDKKEKEGPSAEITLGYSEDGCIAASAGYGSIVEKEYCDGLSLFDFVGPNVSCVLSQGDGFEVVSKCTTEICSVNYVIAKFLLCTLGLSLDTKLVWNADGAEFGVLGTGFETTEGFALTALGSKIGYADIEKSKEARKKRKERQERRMAKNAVQDKQPTR